jgi:hypothetical protein
MSDRAAKQARRAKRKAKQATRASWERHYRCADCGTGPLERGGIEIGGRDGERHYCKACMPPERMAVIMQGGGSWVARADATKGWGRPPDDVVQVDTGGRT